MSRARRRFSLPSRQRVRILLDTQVWLWVLGEPARLSAGGRARPRSPANTFYLSAANVWEIVIKHAAGKLRLPDEPVAYLRGRLAETPATILSITPEHALQLALLPLHHRDPFDRILIAQAQVEGLHLMTADRQFKTYPVDLVSA
jgi:PIN domain nuclease of toxin-antitoxin system